MLRSVPSRCSYTPVITIRNDALPILREATCARRKRVGSSWAAVPRPGEPSARFVHHYSPHWPRSATSYRWINALSRGDGLRARVQAPVTGCAGRPKSMASRAALRSLHTLHFGVFEASQVFEFLCGGPTSDAVGEAQTTQPPTPRPPPSGAEPMLVGSAAARAKRCSVTVADVVVTVLDGGVICARSTACRG